MCDVPGKAGGYFGLGTIYYKTAGNYYLRNHPHLKWITTSIAAMMAVSSPLTITSPYAFFYGRLVLGNVTYLGKVHASGNMGN